MTSFNNTISHNADVLFEVFNCISVKEGKFSLRRVCKRWKEIFDRKLSNILFSKIAPRLQEKPFSFIFEKPITPENAFSSLRLFNETVLEKMGLPCRSETVITNVNDLNALQTRYNESIVALWDEVKKQIEIPQEEMPKTAEEILPDPSLARWCSTT